MRPHLKARVTAVHVVLDNPASLKEIEHRRRDNTTKDLCAWSAVLVDHAREP